jgi:hypothetical protein
LIGLIVGQSRTVPTVITAQYFGYDGQTNATGYGQARYRKRGDNINATSILGDTEYRSAIWGRIWRNWGALDEVSMVEAVQLILGVQGIQLNRPAPAAVEVVIAEYITPAADAMISGLDLIPRAAGVALQIDTI